MKYPIKVEVANHKYEYCRYCFIDEVSIPLRKKDQVGWRPGPQDKVRLQNIVVYVVDGTWGHFLLSWPVLDSLGLTPEKNLHKWKGKSVELTFEYQQTVALDKTLDKSEGKPKVRAAHAHEVELLKAWRASRATEEEFAKTMDKQEWH
ncbi:MAG: hypothetical protein AB8F74_03700 [Saprospiraceae bacterium]